MPKGLLLFLLASLVFGLAYAQAPLYYSNQNQYFLHGLAQAHVGLLDDDWLANTDDPTPLFSAFVAFTARRLHPFLFHVCYALLLGVFLLSVVAIFRHIAAERDSVCLRLVFAAVVTMSFGALGRYFSNRVVGLDLPWYVQAGVAGQYVLGAMLQPSSLGILLVLALALYARGKPFLAILAACVGATIHTTYLLAAGMLTAGFMLDLWRQGHGQRAILAGAWAFALVLPVCVYVYFAFGPTSSDAFRQAQDILVDFRIPHHCLPHLWFDKIAVTQIAWMLLGVALSYGTRLFIPLVVATLLATLLTVLQVATGSDTLALLFPWRVSAIIMPVATAVILARLVLLVRRWLDNRQAMIGAALILGVWALAGLAIMVFRLGFQNMWQELPLMEWVRDNTKKGDVYLIPPEIPEPPLKVTTHGSLSSDFKSLAEKKTDKRIIPIDLMRFRLEAEAPIYVDFKAIPYRDRDVLEWKRRLDFAQAVYRSIRAGTFEEMRPRVLDEKITHVVLPGTLKLGSPATEAYRGDAWRVYRLAP